MAKFGDIGEFRTGGTPSSSHPEYYGTEYPWITTVALGSTYIDSSDAAAFLSNEGLNNSSTKVIDADSLLIGIRVGVGKCSINTVPMCTSQDIVSVVGIDRVKYYLPFLVAFVNSKKDYFEAQKRGATIKGITTALIKDLDVPDLSYEKQQEISSVLEGLQLVIEQHKEMLVQIDLLVKSRFVEMFGDLKTNPKRWPILPFPAFAKIDGNMTTDYEKYADYPHIGIDSIEKGTGELKGYRTVREDGVISGKYVFTPQHIIYSKIRPNLNKVALPAFEGLCSADAYPDLSRCLGIRQAIPKAGLYKILRI